MGPIIKLTIEGMEQTILHHLGQHHQEIEAETKKEIERAIKEFNFEGCVRRVVTAAIEKSIEDYFKYGDGYKAVGVAVAKVFNLSVSEEG